MVWEAGEDRCGVSAIGVSREVNHTQHDNAKHLNIKSQLWQHSADMHRLWLL